MSTLHIVFANELPEALERCWSAGDALLLAGPCVVAALSLSTEANLPSPCYALNSAVRSRGLHAQWPSHIPRLSHSDWLNLLAQHQRSLSWS